MRVQRAELGSSSLEAIPDMPDASTGDGPAGELRPLARSWVRERGGRMGSYVEDANGERWREVYSYVDDDVSLIHTERTTRWASTRWSSLPGTVLQRETRDSMTDLVMVFLEVEIIEMGPGTCWRERSAGSGACSGDDVLSRGGI